MNDLHTAVSAAMGNIIASGAIEQAIEKQLTETIASAVRDQLRSYSPIGKAIETQISAALQIGEMELPSYADLIGKIVRRQVEAGMQNEATRELEESIGALLAPAPAEITLEKLIDDFIERHLEYNDDDRGNSFTLIIQHTEGSCAGYKHIYIDPEAHTSKYSCAIQIDITDKGVLYGLKISGKDLKDQLFIGKPYGFEKKLFQLYTAKSRLIVADDAEASDFDTSFPYHGE